MKTNVNKIVDKYPQEIKDAFRFFHANAGCVVGRRAVGALELARAETRAKEMGLVFSWEPEEFPWDGDVPLAPTDLLEFVACCRWEETFPHLTGNARSEHRRTLASLGMVATTSYHDPYRRVVEAELAREALETLDEECDALATKQADELGARATYAGAAS